MQAGHAVELGDVPRVPRQRRPHAQGGEHPALRAGLAAADLGDGLRERPRPGGCRPTSEHAEMRRLLHEAMDAGACGWSAQRLLPTGPAAVQRDYDGTPMPTDVMHDETCRELAGVLAERNDGFMQMHCVIARQMPHDHGLLRGAGRPSAAGRCIMNVVQAFDHRPHIHRRSSTGWSAAASGASASTARASPPTPASPSPSRTGTSSTTPRRGARPRPARARSACAKLADPAPAPGAASDKLPIIATGRFDEDHRRRPRSARDRAVRRDDAWARRREEMGKHPVDAMLDIAVADDLETVLLRAATSTRRRT